MFLSDLHIKNLNAINLNIGRHRTNIVPARTFSMIILFILSLIPVTTWAETTLCDILELSSCSGVTKQIRRSSSASLPSAASASNLNPANVSFDRGFGIEASHQSHNSVNFNVATGTGKLGGALISQSLENGFFGNRVIELDPVLLERYQERKQYKSKKLNLALGGKLFRKKHVTLDAGILLKRHSVLKNINTGIGLSARLGPIHVGASMYKDDFHLDLKDRIDPHTGIPYEFIFGAETYDDTFKVQTYSVGTKIKNLALDAGVIRSKYDKTDVETVINLYSAAFFYGKFLFNYAIRNEITPSYKIINGELVDQRSQNEIFGGIQYSVGKHLIVGVNYNFYLLREISLNAIVFF
jgi:hypothetical protein